MFNMLLKFGLMILFPFLLVSCGDYGTIDCEDPDYSTCIGIEPDSFDVEILLTQINDSEKIPFILYQGKYDIFGSEPAMYLQDTATSALYVVRLPFDRDYSVKAEYSRPSGTVYAVDGVFLSKKDKKVCDTVCWEIEGKVIDVRLKDIE